MRCDWAECRGEGQNVSVIGGEYRYLCDDHHSAALRGVAPNIRPSARACPRCATRVKTWKGDDPKCAFPDGVFTADNWNCATMNALRDVQESRGNVTAYMDDEWAATLPVRIDPPVDGDPTVFFIIMQGYKRRGRVQQAYEMTDEKVAPLTLATAESALEAR